MPQVEVTPSTLRFLQYYTMILQHPRNIVEDARFEPGTFAPEVWRATKWAITYPTLSASPTFIRQGATLMCHMLTLLHTVPTVCHKGFYFQLFIRVAMGAAKARILCQPNFLATIARGAAKLQKLQYRYFWASFRRTFFGKVLFKIGEGGGGCTSWSTSSASESRSVFTSTFEQWQCPHFTSHARGHHKVPAQSSCSRWYFSVNAAHNSLVKFLRIFFWLRWSSSISMVGMKVTRGRRASVRFPAVGRRGIKKWTLVSSLFSNEGAEVR